MAGKITPVDKHAAPDAVPTTTAPPVWEITTRTVHGHETVHRIAAESEDEALDALPVEAPEVVQVRRP